MPGLGFINFDWSQPTGMQYARPGVLGVGTWWSLRRHKTRYDELRAAGAEAIQYTLPVHDYPWDTGTNTGIPEHVRFYTGGDGHSYRRRDIPKAWFWDPSNPGRCSVPSYSGWLMDMRQGSKWVDHILDVYVEWLASREWRGDGFFLDVTGTGYMGWVTGLRADEQAEFKDGVVSFVSRLRAAVGAECLLVANNSWDTSTRHRPPAGSINGIMVENHDGGEIGNAFWRGQLALVDAPLGRRRNMTTSRTAAAAVAWSQVPGVDHAGHAPSYNVPPDVPFTPAPWPESAGHIPGWVWTGATPPPPPPDPEPEPEPQPEPERITPGLAAAIRSAVNHRMGQQIGRAQTVTGPEYAGRLRERGMSGLADALETNVAQAIAVNAETLIDEIAALIDQAEGA